MEPSKADIKDEIVKLRGEVVRLRDEVKVRLHLGSMELKDLASKLETQLRSAEGDFGDVKRRAESTMRERFSSLRDAYQGLRDKLQKSEKGQPS